MGYEHLSFAPLFGHQYSHVWIDFRGIRDAYDAPARHRLLREHAPRRLRAARLRDRQPEGLVRATAPTSGASPPATARASCASSTATTASATSSTTRRAAPAAARTHRRRHDRADRRALVAAVRARDRDPGRRGDARALRHSSSTRSTASSIRSTAASPRPTCKLSDGRVDPGLRLDRERLHRHRPGPDPGDDRQLPQRARLGRHAQVHAAAARPERAGFEGGWLAETA